MRVRPARLVYGWLALVLFLAGAVRLRAQSHDRIIEEPQWFRMRIDHAETGIYSEGEYETTDFRDSNQSVSYERLFIGPTLGLGLNGSIYHPYFLTFRADGEGAFGWSEQNATSPVRSIHTDGMDVLGQFQSSAQLFSQKPLNGSFFGGYSRGYRDYDFFNRVTAEVFNYGGRLNYNTPSLFLSTYYNHTDDNVIDPLLASAYHQDTAGFQGRNDRQSGSTSLSYTLSRYDTSQYGGTGTAMDHSFTASDSERFGDHEQIRLTSNASYTRRDDSLLSSDQVDANINLAIDHTPRLGTAYNVSYDRYTSGPYLSDNYEADFQLRHRLYESLTSTFSLRALDNESSDPLNSGYTRMYGGGLALAYIKHLGTEHTLQLNNSIQIDQTEQKGVGTVLNEKHTVGTPPDSFELSLPNVEVATIVVMDANRVRVYSPVIDYAVEQNGQRTFIRLVAGTTIPANSVVSVDYRAIPAGAGDYQSIGDFAGFRIDLWHGLWGVYGRVGVAENNAPAALLVQNMVSYALGTDFHWHWFGAGGEYDIYDSNQTQYRSGRLYETVNFVLDTASSVGANATESFIDYLDAHRQEQDYRFTSFYRRNMSRSLRLNFEAGFDVHRGPGVDQTLAALRPSVDYLIGKTSISASYDYEYSLFLNSEERNKHMFMVRLRRVF